MNINYFNNWIIAPSYYAICIITKDADWFRMGGDTVHHVTMMTNQMQRAVNMTSNDTSIKDRTKERKREYIN